MLENRSIENLIAHVKIKIQLEDVHDELEQTSIMFTILSIYIPPVIIALGSIGNIVSFLVLLKICKIDVMFSETSMFKSARLVIGNTLKQLTTVTSKRKSETNLNNYAFDALLVENNEASPVKKSSRDSVIKLKHTSSNGTTTIYLYLCALAVFDLGVLYFGLLNDWLHDLAHKSLKSYSGFFCKSITFLAFVTSHSSSFLIVMTSFIRFVAFYSPFKTATLINKNNFKTTLASIVGAFVALNAHFLWTMHLAEAEDQTSSLLEIYKNDSSDFIAEMLRNLSVNKLYECRIKPSQFSQTIWPVIDKFVYSLLPFILILVFNMLIIINVTKTQKYNYIVYMSKLKSASGGFNNEAIELESINKAYKCRLMSVSSFADRKKLRTFSRSGAAGFRLGDDYCMEINPNRGQGSPNARSNSAKLNPELISAQIEIAKKIQSLKKKTFFGKRFTFMLIGLSISFLVLTLPVVVIIVLAEPLKQLIDSIEDISESNRKYELLGMAQRVAFLLMYLNHSINFLVYYATSARFRRQFESMFLSESCSLVALLTKVRKYFQCRAKNYERHSFFVFRKDNSLYA
jgi:hypothetical protein